MAMPNGKFMIIGRHDGGYTAVSVYYSLPRPLDDNIKEEFLADIAAKLDERVSPHIEEKAYNYVNKLMSEYYFLEDFGFVIEVTFAAKDTIIVLEQSLLDEIRNIIAETVVKYNLEQIH